MYCRKDMGIKEMCILLIMHNGCAFARDGTVHEKKERVSRSVLTHTEIPFRVSTSLCQYGCSSVICKNILLRVCTAKNTANLCFSLNVLLVHVTQIHIAVPSIFSFRTISNLTSGGPESSKNK